MKEHTIVEGDAYAVEQDATTGLRRMTVSMGGVCPVGCRYCYTYDPGFKGYPVRDANSIVAELRRRSDQFDVLQWGYDTEPFLPENKQTTLTALEAIADMNKHVSFASRIPLDDTDIERVASVSEKMRLQGKFLVGFHSYLGKRAIEELEPNAPSASARLDGMRRQFNKGIATFTFIRPLLPTITDTELEDILAETQDRCTGCVVGEVFYRDSVDGTRSVKRQRRHQALGLTHATRQGASMSFGADQNNWNVYEDPRIQRLTTEHENIFAHSSEVFPYLAEQLG